MANKKQGREIKCRTKWCVHIYLELEQPKKMKVQLKTTQHKIIIMEHLKQYMYTQELTSYSNTKYRNITLPQNIITRARKEQILRYGNSAGSKRSETVRGSGQEGVFIHYVKRRFNNTGLYLKFFKTLKIIMTYTEV